MKGSKPACIANVILMTFMTVSLMAFLGMNNYNALVFLSTFNCGFQDSAISTHSIEVLGFEFTPDREEHE